MRDTVQIDGVTLTRAQVEKAMEQLKVQALQPGDVCLSTHYGPVVLVNPQDSWLTTSAKEDIGDGRMASLMDTGALDGFFAASLVRIGTLSEIVKFYREAKGL